MRALIFLLCCLLAGPAPAQSRPSTAKPAAPRPAAPTKATKSPTKSPKSPKSIDPAKPSPAQPSALPGPKLEWRPVYYQGRAYVPANQVADYYDLRVPDGWPKAFSLRSADRKFTIDLTTGQKRVKLSGWTFYFSFPVVQPKGVPLISVFDVRNVLDPILRPNDRRDPAILRTVVIDPAGGGKEVGIKSPAINEKDLTLAVAKLLAPLLQAKGYRVVLTRESDRSLLPGLRVVAANDVAEEAIYLNLRAASGAPALRGFECATLPPAGTPATNESDSPDIDRRFFAGNINDRESLALATTVQNSVVRQVRSLDLGIRRVRVDELRDIRMAAISCKLGYLSNREEAKLLATRDYQAQLASAMGQGVDRYAQFLRSGYEKRAEEDRVRPLSFGPISVKQEPLAAPAGSEKVTLRVPIVGTTPAGAAAVGPGIDRSRMELQVFLFETVNGGEIDLTTANPPEVNWLSVLPDWKEGVPEWLQLSYLRPSATAAESKAYGNRAYYGYVARLIYDGRLLDEAAYPANLDRALYYFVPVFPRR